MTHALQTCISQANTSLLRDLLSEPVLVIVNQDEELLAWLRRLQISLAVLLRMGLCTPDRLYRARAMCAVISEKKGASGVEKHLKRQVSMVCVSRVQSTRRIAHGDCLLCRSTSSYSHLMQSMTKPCILLSYGLC